MRPACDATWCDPWPTWRLALKSGSFCVPCHKVILWQRQEAYSLSISQISSKACWVSKKAIGPCGLHSYLPQTLLSYRDACRGHEQLCLLTELDERRCRGTRRVAAQGQVRGNCIY